MKSLRIVFDIVAVGLAAAALWFSFFRADERLRPAAVFSRSGSSTEDVVYMSDIDGLVKAVMLYGVTNGITYNGTNYMFVVEPKED